MMIYVNNTYDYMNALLDDVYLKQLSKLISKRVEEIYGYVRDEIKEVIEHQINVIISNKFEIFKNAVLASIPNYFLDQLKRIIESNYFFSTLYNEKVYNLIPTEFTDGFRANLTQYLHSELTTDKLKDKYKNRVYSDFNDIILILSQYHEKMGKRASDASHTYTNAAMNTIIQRYLEWDKEVSAFDILYSLDVPQSKIDKIIEFFNKEIIPSLNNISDGYDTERGIQIRNLEAVLKQYRMVDFLKEVKAQLAKMKFESNIEVINNNTKKIMDDLYNKVKTMFDNIAPKLKADFQEPLIGFKEKNRNLRNLLTYDLRQINDQLSITQQRYTRFKEELLRNDNLIAVAAQVGAFKGQIINSAEHLTDFIHSYKMLIADFIDPSQVTDALETSANQVRVFLMTYTMNLSQNIYETISVIKSRINNGWVQIKQKIDTSITSTLDYVFKLLFSKLSTFSENKNVTLKISTPFEYYVYDEKDEVVAKVNILFDSILIKYGFSLEKYNTYYFRSTISTNANLNAEIDLTVDESMKVVDKGTIGAGTIGMAISYILDDKSVQAELSVQTDNTKYVKEYREINFDNLNWVTRQSLSQESRISTSTKFTKLFKNGICRISQYYTPT
jgi:hypothetical protein